MKAGLVTSTILHGLLLTAGLLSLSAPKPHDVLDVEALPIDIVPVEDITRVLEGDKEAPVAETPAPVPTSRPQTVPDAQEVGDNSEDTPAPPTPDPKPRPVETAAAPKPAAEPAPRPLPEPEPAPTPPAPEPAPVPATEVTPQPQPRQEVKPEPTPEPTPAPVAEPDPAPEPEPAPTETAQAADALLPDTAPRPDLRPQPRPQPPQAQTAKAPERKEAEKPAVKQAQQQPADKPDDNLLDDVAALLNKEKPSGGGAKRSTEQAALGGERKTTGEKLSQSEMDALRQRLGGCWNIPAGVEDAEALKVSVRFRLDRSGNLDGRPEVVRGGASSGPGRIAAESAVRAVQKCEPFNLPADKYETWAEVVVNFDPTDMF